MTEKKCDLLIIGGGIGGYSAALRAREYGKGAIIVEQDVIGGTCLNRGCIPTKALIHLAKEAKVSGKHLEESKTEEDSGFFGKVEEEIRAKVTLLVKGLTIKLEQAEVEIMHGKAVAVETSGQRWIDVAKPAPAGEGTALIKTRIAFDQLIIATGSVPAVPAGLLLGDHVFTSDRAFERSNLELDRIAVIGGGIIGVEFASAYADLGKNVTLIEPMEELISGFTPALSSFAEKFLKRKGVKVKTSTSVMSILEEDGEVILKTQNADHSTEETLYDKALVCTGRKANIDFQIVNALGVEVKNGLIVVDEDGQTSVESVYAIGDVSSRTQLAYTAARNGEKVVDKIYGNKKSKNESIPKCVYMDMELAQVGKCISDKEDDEYVAEVFYLKANGRSVIEGNTSGFVRITAERKTGAVTGFELVMPDAVDCIQLCKMFVDERKTVGQISEMVFPHPSYIEALKDAAGLVRKRLSNDANLEV